MQRYKKNLINKEMGGVFFCLGSVAAPFLQEDGQGWGHRAAGAGWEYVPLQQGGEGRVEGERKVSYNY